MDTIIRCHVKNPQRLATLERAIMSWHEKQLNRIGVLYLMDDHSPMANDVIALAGRWGARYRAASGTPDTKNGLYNSLKLREHDDTLALYCADDMVFGRDIAAQVYWLENKIIPLLGPFATVGLFACYENDTRSLNRLPNDLWRVPNELIYAMNCHIFSTQLKQALIAHWELGGASLPPFDTMGDDIWAKLVAKDLGLECYNTMLDYAQHTGMNNRAIGSDPNAVSSEYYTNCFVGE